MKKYTLLKLLLPAAILGCTQLHAQNTIVTMAGNGIAGNTGDGGQATEASLNMPAGVTVGPNGDIYIADEYNNKVRKVAVGGIITTFAGTGTMGYTGNGGQAMDAGLEYPVGVALDATGNVYITEWYADDVRKVTPAGIIAPDCGNGEQGGDGDNGLAILARMEVPAGAALDAEGNMYIPDVGNSKIRKVNAATGIVTTIANYPYGGVQGLCLDGVGNMYVITNNQIVKRNLNTGVSMPFAGTGSYGYTGDGGPAVSATFSYPASICVGPDGTVYVADENNSVIRAISYDEVSGYNIISTFAGNGTPGFSGDEGLATSAKLNEPTGVFFYGNSDLYIADMGNNRIRKVIIAVPKATNINTLGTGSETVYPDPSNGSFTLQVTAAKVGSSFVIFDMAGRTVYSAVIADVQTKIDLSNQPAGIYTMRMANGQAHRIAIVK